MANPYAQAGVDVDIEARASAIMYEACKKTLPNRAGKIGEVKTLTDSFSGGRFVPIGGLPLGSCMFMGFDGAGTMVEVAQRMDDHSTIGWHLIAMLADDAPVRGGEAALVGSVLDIKSLGMDERHLPKILGLARGAVAAARAADVAVINGEIAQMGALISGYGDFPFTWGGACIWFAREDRLFTGMEIQVGDRVVMFREPHVRTNGISLPRKVFSQYYGGHWHEERFGESTLGVELMRAPVIYSRLATHLHGGFAGEPAAKIHGFCHITGGGIPEKMGRLLKPSGLGAQLTRLFNPPSLVLHCQELTRRTRLDGLDQVSDFDAYKTWGMGHGYAAVTPEPDKVIAEAAKFGVEAIDAGPVTAQPGIAIVSQGLERFGEILTY